MKLITKDPKAGEKREPLFHEGRHFVELFSYGQVNPIGHALMAARDYFAGKDNIRALEIGVLRGHNAENICNILKPELLVLVDLWELSQGSLEYHDNNWAETYYRVQGRSNVVVIKASSEVASKILYQSYDFIYIDGDHGDIEYDIKLWYPCMNTHGIFSGHDYNYSNIKEAVDKFGEFIGKKVFTSPEHPQGGMDWWIFT